MGVAATFSRKTAEENGIVIGHEERALGIDIALQPFVNIDRDLESLAAATTPSAKTRSSPPRWASPR
jgi:beta-glucosidase-like glycosyl hydrolase